jgi:hypothetical protein
MKLRLGPMPSTEIFKLTIALPLELKQQLDRYAELHAAQYGQSITIPALIVQMVAQFITRDRGFHRSQREASANLRSRPE